MSAQLPSRDQRSCAAWRRASASRSISVRPPRDTGASSPLTGGAFRGEVISGMLLPGDERRLADNPPDGTALADLRYTLKTDAGQLLYVRARGTRHESTEVLARLARGEDVNASEYTFRTATETQTAESPLEWLNKGVFVSVGGRQPAGVIYETYLVELAHRSLKVAIADHKAKEMEQ